MKTLRSHEGWMFIDNRNNQGVPDEIMTKLGFPAGAGRGTYESATYTCSHCDAVVVMEPKRTRERGYCKKCDRHICDACNLLKAKTFECKTMAQIAIEVQIAADKSPTAEPSIILLNP